MPCLVLRPGNLVYSPLDDAHAKVTGMVAAWNERPDQGQWKDFLNASLEPASPRQFEPARDPAVNCPAYQGMVRGHHRCAANDLPPWEKFEDFAGEAGVATCGQCNWPERQNN